MNQQPVNNNSTEAKTVQPAAPTYGAAKTVQPAAPTYGAVKTADGVSYDIWRRQEEEENKIRREAVKEASEKMPMVLIALLTLIFGIIYSGLVVRSGMGLGLTAVTLIFYALYSAFIVKKNKAARLPSILLAIPTLLLTLSFSINSYSRGRGLIMVLALAALFITHTTLIAGCTPADNVLSLRTAANALYTWIAAPFVNMGAAFSSVFKSREKAEKKGEKAAAGIGKVLIGLVIALPAAAILMLVLTSADAVFLEFVEKMGEWLESLNISIGNVIIDILVGLVFTAFIVPAVLSLRSGYVKNRELKEPAAWMDSVIAATIAYVIGAVFVLFVIIQMGYFFPVSIGYYFNYDFNTVLTLPENMTWAEYARSGFFELSGVIIAAFIGIAACVAFCRRNGKGELPVYLKIALTVISVCSFIMAISAVLRMRLYTIWCGLTAKRLGVLMIIAVISISLVAACIKLWKNKFPLFKVVAAVSIAAVTVFGCMNVDRICANVNVDRHLNEGTTIDMSYMGELSYGAVPAVSRLYKNTTDEDVRAAALGLLVENYYIRSDGSYDKNGHATTHCGVGAITVDRVLAEAACASVKQNINGEFKPEMMRDFDLYADWQDDKNNYERWNDDEYMDFDEYVEEYGDNWEYNEYYSYLG